MSELQEAVSRNVRVLMAIRGIRSQRALAAQVGVNYTNFNKKLIGKNNWTLEDIELLADEFHIEPASLLGDGREFLDPPTRTGTSGYVPSNRATRLILFPQVSAETPELSGLATIIPLQRRTSAYAIRTSLAVTG